MSDYERTQRRRNIIVGVFVIIALCALFWMVFKFGDLPLLVSEWKSFQITVQFPTASGVQENTPVRFCGYQIGRVVKVRPPKVLKDLKTGRLYHQAVVVINIDKKYDTIPTDVEVKLMSRGLGSSYIELRVPSLEEREGAGFLTEGDILQGSTGVTSEFFPEESQKKLDKLVTGLGDLVKNANDVLGDAENKENIKSTLANLSEAAQKATESLEEFQKFSIAGTSTGEELSRTVAELRTVLEKINIGEGTAGKLINDGRLYENLLENTRQLEVLLEELRSFLAKAKEKGMPIKLK